MEMLRDKRENVEYIAEQFDYNNIEYGIYFTQYKYLFNMDPNHPKIQIIPLLAKEIIN